VAVYFFKKSFSCGNITNEKLFDLIFKNSEIGRLTYHILNNPDKY